MKYQIRQKNQIEGQYEHQLRKMVTGKIFILIFVGAGLFLMGLLAVEYITNQINANHNLRDLEETYVQLYERNCAYLEDPAVQEMCIKLLTGQSDASDVQYNFNRFNSYSNVQNDIVDDHNNVIYSSAAGFIGKVGKFYGFDGRYYDLNQDRYCARAIQHLVSEIRVIQKENSAHRVDMNMGNEFDEVADTINDMLDDLQHLNNRNLELLSINNTIELNQLTAQINPHFLYNTLEIIRNLLMWDQKQASEIIVKLTDILRYSVNRTMQDVYLGEDILYLQEYLDIQKSRFGDRFTCDIKIDPDCERCMIPKLVLQPIIENSIKYGFRQKMEIHVTVRGWMEGSMLKLQVTDDGPGMSYEEAEKKNHDIRQVCEVSKSIGLHNISRRLCLQYGGESGIQLCPGEKEGLIVNINILQEDAKASVMVEE